MADWRVTVPPGGATTEGAGWATTGAEGGGIMLSTGRGAMANEFRIPAKKNESKNSSKRSESIHDCLACLRSIL